MPPRRARTPARERLAFDTWLNCASCAPNRLYCSAQYCTPYHHMWCTAPCPQTGCTAVHSTAHPISTCGVLYHVPKTGCTAVHCTAHPVTTCGVYRLYCSPRHPTGCTAHPSTQQVVLVVLLTVSPKRQKRGIFLPTTPLMTGPLWAPTRRDTWPPRGSHMLDVAHSAALAKSMTCGHSQGALEGEGGQERRVLQGEGGHV